MMRAWTNGMVLILVCLSLPVSILAQAEGSQQERQQTGCFRGRPLPACKSFWIFEMQVTERLAQTTRAFGFDPELAEFERTAIEWNLGYMANLDSTYAIGGMVTVGHPVALALRVRRWLDTNWSLEAQGGLALGQSLPTPATTNVGGTAALRLNIRDQGSIYVRWDMLSIPEWSDDDGFFDVGGVQHALSVGVGAGSVPAVIGTGAFAVGSLVYAAMLLATDWG